MKQNDEFTRLFSYMTERFDNIDKSLENKANTSDINRIINTLDAISKQQEISEDERLVLAHQLTLLHNWVEKAAKKIGVTFAR